MTALFKIHNKFIHAIIFRQSVTICYAFYFIKLVLSLLSLAEDSRHHLEKKNLRKTDIGSKK